MVHVTARGKRIPLGQLELNHLENIIKWLERRAERGIAIHNYAKRSKTSLKDNEALEYLNYPKYVEELRKRHCNQLKR
jgi:hypothetical protein